ncbi:MAG: arginine--tRNA ligase [Actinobacteria bacterium]|nr:arginine--tRNA ligase [Actinomycetota bacterium]
MTGTEQDAAAVPGAAVSGPAGLAGLVRAALVAEGLPDAEPAFERPRQRQHGDWSTNVALKLARPAGRPPRELAAAIVGRIGGAPGVEEVQVAGPGFINFRLAHSAFEETIRDAVTLGEAYGRGDAGRGRRAQVEFVSANPTGPLHVGHGRQAALGDAIAGLLDATGWEVEREYYFNDAGNQMERFGASVAAAARGEEPPEDGYHGAYVAHLAAELTEEELAGDITEAAYGRMLERIKSTLAAFGVVFDSYFGERALHASGAIERVVGRLREAGHAYDAAGATWLRTTAFGDDKDRVLLRADGRPTYFAADCAYLASKVARGFDRCIYVLGADHHGYVTRLHAIAAAEGLPDDRVEVVLHQFVNLYRAGVPVRMSKRTGDIVTFDELLDEVGPDAARYTLLRFSADATIDFDIAEVVRADRDNPVYYVQYSSARIAGIMRTASERGVRPGDVDDAPLHLLVHDAELELVRRIGAYPETVAFAAEVRAPHRVARYAEELAEAFHKFYTECQVVGDDAELTRARYWLCVAARQALANALGLLGVHAPERM